MKVAFNTYPLTSAHKDRGVGSYTTNLLEALERLQDLRIVKFGNNNKIPQADLVHYPVFDFYFHTLPLNSRLPRVVTIHDAIPLVFPQHFPVGIRGKINYKLQKRALKNTSAVICVSKTSKKDIEEKLNYPSEKIYYIYSAPGNNFRRIKDENAIKDIAQKYHLPRNFALYVGDLNWNKNIHSLLKAAKIADVNLVLVGKAASDPNLLQAKELTEEIKNSKAESKIRVLGFVPEEDLITIYNAATVTILPSFYEGFGLPVLESMACGTPVICSKTSSLVEIGGEAAVFCDPQSIEDIAQKIKEVFSLSPEKLFRLQKKSLKNASMYSWHKTAAETLKVYELIVQK